MTPAERIGSGRAGMACTNGATASCIAACAPALGMGSGSPPASNSASALSAVMPFAASQARVVRLRPPARGKRRERRRDAAGLHAEQRIGGPRFRDRRQRDMAQAIRGSPRPAERRGPPRPGPAAALRPVAQANPATPARRCRTAAPARRTPPPPDRAGWRRAHGRSPATHPSHSRCRAAASRPARSATPIASRDAAGALRVSAVTAVSTASANAGASKPPARIVERGEVQHEARQRPPSAPARPTRMARHAAAAASGAAARPAAPPARRAARVRPPDGSRHRPPPPASPAPRPAPGRPAQPPPHRPRPPAASPAASARRDPRPPSRGASARPARSGWSSCPHAMRAPATRKAYFASIARKRPQNPVDEPPGGP